MPAFRWNRQSLRSRVPVYRRLTASRVVKLVGLCGALAACRPKEAPVAPYEPSDQARRAVQSFVQCVEQSGPPCVGSSPQQRAYGSFAALAWLHSGSPLMLLGAADKVLATRQDLAKNQVRFVGMVRDLYSQMRGAQCSTTALQPIPQAVETLHRETATRLEALDLWPGQRQELLNLLTQEINVGLGSGFVAAVSCVEAPWLFYVVTAFEEGRHSVVGMTTALPASLMPSLDPNVLAKAEAQAIASSGASDLYHVQEGLVHPWIKIPVEEL